MMHIETERIIIRDFTRSDAARKLYKRFGFLEIDRDEDEIIMELSF